jgi:hypothetical protein
VSAREQAVLWHALAPIAALVRALDGGAGPWHWEWDDAREALFAPRVAGGLRLGLEPDVLQVVAVGADGRVQAELSLLDLSPAEALAQLVVLARELGLDAEGAALWPEDLPTTPLAGGTFAPGDALARTRLAPTLAERGPG